MIKVKELCMFGVLFTDDSLCIYEYFMNKLFITFNSQSLASFQTKTMTVRFMNVNKQLWSNMNDSHIQQCEYCQPLPVKYWYKAHANIITECTIFW